MTLGEVAEKYGCVPLRFRSYYKYCFYFSGEAPDGTIIRLRFGGESEDIYRYRLIVDEPVTLNEYRNSDSHVQIIKGRGNQAKVVFAAYDCW